VDRVNRLKRHLSVANVLSCIALFVALGSGAAFAATKMAKLGNGQVKAVNIANQAVTNPKIKTQAVTSGKIKNLGVFSADLGAGSVINSKIAKKAVTESKLGTESVVNSKIAKKAVTESKIGAEAVTTGKLGKEAVSYEKLSTGVWSQLVKNVSYFNSASVTNGEPNKTASAECPAGKSAISGGARLEGELANVATTGSYPLGASRNGWTAVGHETGSGPFNDWSITAFVVCAEL
jgi:hypothetical protein